VALINEHQWLDTLFHSPPASEEVFINHINWLYFVINKLAAILNCRQNEPTANNEAKE